MFKLKVFNMQDAIRLVVGVGEVPGTLNVGLAVHKQINSNFNNSELKPNRYMSIFVKNKNIDSESNKTLEYKTLEYKRYYYNKG